MPIHFPSIFYLFNVINSYKCFLMIIHAIFHWFTNKFVYLCSMFAYKLASWENNIIDIMALTLPAWHLYMLLLYTLSLL